jgi:hypothetical protein
MFTSKQKHMKQLIIILSIVLCVTNGFSQTDSIFEKQYTYYGYVDFYKLLDIPHGIGEEAFLGELGKYFNQMGATKGYSSWQLYGFDYKRGTFFMAEFFKANQPIEMGSGKLLVPSDVVDFVSKKKK